jgi:hypothetical protein
VATCNDCKSYFESEEDSSKGDCVTRATDARQSYFSAKPVANDSDASKCSSFQVKLGTVK